MRQIVKITEPSVHPWRLPPAPTCRPAETSLQH